MTLVKTTKILKAVKIFLAQQLKEEAYTDTSLTPVLKALPEKAINRFRTYLSEFPNQFISEIWNHELDLDLIPYGSIRIFLLKLYALSVIWIKKTVFCF